MSCCHESVAQQVRSGTARVLVTELSGSGQINPTPATKPYDDCDETAVELYLSPEKLESLCGTQDLCHMTSLEICVDTQEITLGDFGAFLPKLVQLKMNNSIIMSVRDLGTTLSHLQVLWMSHCCLQDLDGISTFSSLKELYVAYNSVSDLSQVGMLENLQLLDLEGNDVDDLVQVQYLGLCGKLQTLTLEGNPVCKSPNPTTTQMTDYRYRAAVRELVPQLCYLDNLRVEEDEMNCNIMMEEDWAILRNSIRTRNSSRSPTEDEETVDSVFPYSRPSSARCSVSSRSGVWSLSPDSRPLTGSRPSTSSRPHTGSRPLTSTGPGVLSPPGSRPGSAGSDLAETSILTHGAGKILFCGNPVRAIQARRDKLRTAPTRSTFTPHDLPMHVPEHTYDLEECDVRESTDVFAELRAWREQHNRRLQAIETERLPQVLAIHHSDDEEEEDDGEEGLGSMENDCSEEHGEKSDDSLDTASPDSFLQSLSPDLCHREDLSSDVAQLLSLTPDTRPSPCPPVSATAVSGNQKPQGIRARRFRLSQANSEHFPDSSRIGFSRGTTGTTERDSDQILQNIQHVTRTNVPLLSKAAHIPCPPPTKGLGRRLKDSSTRMDASNVKCENKQLHALQQHKLPDRPAIARPHTARAALQKHHQHHILQPCRGSSHPD